MRHRSIWLLPLALWACNPDGAASDEGSDSAGADARGPEPGPLATPSGDCPDLSSGGSLTITSSGEARDFTLLLPDPMVKPFKATHKHLRGKSGASQW